MAVPIAMQPTTTVKQPMMMVPVNTTRTWTALVSLGEIVYAAVWMIQQLTTIQRLTTMTEAVSIMMVRCMLFGKKKSREQERCGL